MVPAVHEGSASSGEQRRCGIRHISGLDIDGSVRIVRCNVRADVSHNIIEDTIGSQTVGTVDFPESTVRIVRAFEADVVRVVQPLGHFHIYLGTERVTVISIFHAAPEETSTVEITS